MSSLLNYKQAGQGQTIVLIHGLFGNLDNLGLLARDLQRDFHVISVDLRNHGLSFHHHEHSYTAMAKDVAELLDHLKIESCILIGHSMGGKVAMQCSAFYPQLISQLIVLDMAPVAYQQNRHENVFQGLMVVENDRPETRQEAMQLLSQHIDMESVRQFLSKSLHKKSSVNDSTDHKKEYWGWRFSVNNLFLNYSNIMGWTTNNQAQLPTLFIKGQQSDYITQAYQANVLEQFPNAKAHIVTNTGHWLHAEKPTDVLRIIRKFIM